MFGCRNIGFTGFIVGCKGNVKMNEAAFVGGFK